MTTPSRHSVLYQSTRLHIRLDAQRMVHIVDRRTGAAVLSLYAPAIMDVTAVACGPSTGYIHWTGPFQSTTRRGERRNLRSIGPYSHEEVERVVVTIKGSLGLPVTPLEVSCEALLADPARYHGRIVRARGPWRQHESGSQFAGAWLVLPDDWNMYGHSGAHAPEATDSSLIDVVGLWWADGRGYGEHGRWSALIQAYLLEVLPDLTAALKPVTPARPARRARRARPARTPMPPAAFELAHETLDTPFPL